MAAVAAWDEGRGGLPRAEDRDRGHAQERGFGVRPDHFWGSFHYIAGGFPGQDIFQFQYFLIGHPYFNPWHSIKIRIVRSYVLKSGELHQKEINRIVCH